MPSPTAAPFDSDAFENARTQSPFGRIITAMVTPMHESGAVDFDGLQRLAEHLADNGHDGLVVNGTTGESATTTDEEDYRAVAAVVEAVGDRVSVIAGCGTNDTEHSSRAAGEMMERGADAALVVTPYYNKPTQDGIVEHVRRVAKSAGKPVLLYDIPGRTGLALAADTIRRLAEIEHVAGLKDAKGSLFESSHLMAETGLLWFSGEDELNLAHLVQGATGIVSVVGHVAGRQYAEMLAAVDTGNIKRARELHHQLIPALKAIMHVSQGAIQVKAAMQLLGVIDSRMVRLPLLPASDADVETVRVALDRSGLS